MNENEPNCAACGGTQLQDGKLGLWKHTFMPGDKMMMFGYPVRARVCLDCGSVGHYLSRSDLETIKHGR